MDSSKKAGCGMVCFNSKHLLLFADYGPPPTDIQPGAVFTRDTRYADGSGTLVLHVNIFARLNKKTGRSLATRLYIPTPTHTYTHTHTQTLHSEETKASSKSQSVSK